MTTADMDKAIKVRRLFGELYHDTGLVSVESGTGIQLQKEVFFEIFAGADITERPRNREAYPYEYSAEYKGERFFCIGDKREADDEKGN